MLRSCEKPRKPSVRAILQKRRIGTRQHIQKQSKNVQPRSTRQKKSARTQRKIASPQSKREQTLNKNA